jgi:hypothetical protein
MLQGRFKSAIAEVGQRGLLAVGQRELLLCGGGGHEPCASAEEGKSGNVLNLLPIHSS